MKTLGMNQSKKISKCRPLNTRRIIKDTFIKCWQNIKHFIQNELPSEDVKNFELFRHFLVVMLLREQRHSRMKGKKLHNTNNKLLTNNFEELNKLLIWNEERESKRGKKERKPISGIALKAHLQKINSSSCLSRPKYSIDKCTCEDWRIAFEESERSTLV